MTTESFIGRCRRHMTKSRHGVRRIRRNCRQKKNCSLLFLLFLLLSFEKMNMNTKMTISQAVNQTVRKTI